MGRPVRPVKLKDSSKALSGESVASREKKLGGHQEPRALCFPALPGCTLTVPLLLSAGSPCFHKPCTPPQPHFTRLSMSSTHSRSATDPGRPPLISKRNQSEQGKAWCSLSCGSLGLFAVPCGWGGQDAHTAAGSRSGGERRSKAGPSGEGRVWEVEALWHRAAQDSGGKWRANAPHRPALSGVGGSLDLEVGA